MTATIDRAVVAFAHALEDRESRDAAALAAVLDVHVKAVSAIGGIRAVSGIGAAAIRDAVGVICSCFRGARKAGRLAGVFAVLAGCAVRVSRALRCHTAVAAAGGTSDQGQRASRDRTIWVSASQVTRGRFCSPSIWRLLQRVRSADIASVSAIHFCCCVLLLRDDPAVGQINSCASGTISL